MLLKSLSDQVDLLWKCPVEIVRFVYALEQICLHRATTAESPELQKRATEHLQLVYAIEDAILAEERLVHMRNEARLA